MSCGGGGYGGCGSGGAFALSGGCGGGSRIHIGGSCGGGKTVYVSRSGCGGLSFSVSSGCGNVPASDKDIRNVFNQLRKNGG